MTHSPLPSLADVTFGSYIQVWMLRPATAWFLTVTLALNSGANWLPHPTGHTPPDGVATVESPARQTVIFGCVLALGLMLALALALALVLRDGVAQGDAVGDPVHATPFTVN